MDKEKMSRRCLTEKELEQVTGGYSPQRSCEIYQYRNKYRECQNPYKGLCKQCCKCDFNEE